MATLYVRDVPERLYERLRARARRNGRSLNAEVIELLQADVGRETDAAAITRELREIAKRVKAEPDAPTPERLIRQGREEHDAKILGL